MNKPEPEGRAPAEGSKSDHGRQPEENDDRSQDEGGVGGNRERIDLLPLTV